MDVALEHSNHNVKVGVNAIYSHFKSWRPILKDTGKPAGPFGTITGTRKSSKKPNTMPNWIALSISTVEKCAAMQVVKQPAQWKDSTTEEQKCSSF